MTSSRHCRYTGYSGYVGAYDEEILVSGDGLPAGEPNSQTRLVMLKCKDDFIGMLGILQYIDPPLPEPPPRSNPNRVRIGESVYVLHHEDVKGVYENCKPYPVSRWCVSPLSVSTPSPMAGLPCSGHQFL
ncbi:MAG: hypothetical protein CM15mP103_04090 [Gammaproteobacteria bacterium]|nr:MAG: hypothetical protein CM15mP103_04090 [Gammaproteobacteria bacterium]